MRWGAAPVTSSPPNRTGPPPPAEAPRALGGWREAAHQVEERGLPRAVRADERGDGPRPHVERGAVHGPKPSEANREPVDRENRRLSLRDGAPPSCRRGPAAGTP